MTVGGAVGEAIDRVIVVVPARDEEELLPRCLAALTVAVGEVARVAGEAPPVIEVVVVLDRCSDGTAEVAADWPAFASISTDGGGVGLARRAGARHLLPTLTHFSTATWIATTDADSAVPPNWLTAQLAFARNSVDLVLGTVVPDDRLSDGGRELWDAAHRLVEGHPHVHGANLGVRADRYLQAGEFALVDGNEDVRLVSALRRLGVSEIRTELIPVLTSGRLAGRAPAGFAGYLRDQAAGARVGVLPDAADVSL
ncbi:glycosyltransferase family 2 protein [Cryobacterium sp. TMT1-21]|uniref:4,4'-diaponeurosporenoate glycosyltransferase n=1 Tax=Cryobacterium shii TaxID=1259235 RepID=A0AAQ2C645_9MICO|nr:MULTISPECIES: glycosyltransferase family A protein [Cryobacterium]TFC46607.1 glycosyltransferase family 2 protein [Cryobacterium shii]TFC89148.1 glycosyltransferase family 2 protein [Cryobacterium sp. TmT2-59]TFD17625.1 glycosyltransferase family 2 protein [Cryobacterium sp. TMT1-21]TFD22698.1 glycosyltransferase family 2 protein [Cryobacterium sp. TMT2-23]TFD43339.1 glycosyltransferase family 2 protein [Cryobacterium sp. TMT2-10]